VVVERVTSVVSVVVVGTGTPVVSVVVIYVVVGVGGGVGARIVVYAVVVVGLGVGARIVVYAVVVVGLVVVIAGRWLTEHDVEYSVTRLVIYTGLELKFRTAVVYVRPENKEVLRFQKIEP
jgi:hypothetical protein